MRQLLVGLLFVSSLFLNGCSGEQRPKVCTVRGKVTLKGNPVIMAKIYFAPVAGGQSSEGETGADGSYELYFRRDMPGAVPGKHKVTISTYVSPDSDDSGKKTGGRPETIPREYNLNSTLEKEVIDGENVIDFNL